MGLWRAPISFTSVATECVHHNERRERLEISRFAHYLARWREYRLSNLVRQQLTQVVEGYTGPCDEEAARHGIEWMRNQYRARGERPSF